MAALLQTINFDNPCVGQASGMAGYYFIQLMQMLLASHCSLGDPNDYPKDYNDTLHDNDEFDFIIVGGGSTGSVIANRLSEISSWKILVIEAGGNPTFESDIPMFSPSLPGRDLDWNFVTKRNKYSCLGMEDEVCGLFQGKVLGGTSTINGMHYIRGNPSDYDEWESFGNKGWSFENVLRYFKKSERLHPEFKIIKNSDYEKAFDEYKKLFKSDEWKLDPPPKIAAGQYHSKIGVMGVDHFAHDVFLSPVKKALCEAAEEVGVPYITDVNWMSQIGCAQAMAVLQEAARGNAAKIFLSRVKNRKNLFVLKNSEVEKFIINDKTAVGVVLSKNKKKISVLAKKEVILSAGAINSPRLLLLSGIGPKNDLKSVGVKPIHDLPGVGKNFQTHLVFYGLPFAVSEDKVESISQLQKIDAMYHFLSKGEGIFGNVGLNDLVTFVSSSKNDTVPDVQFLHYFNYVKDHYTLNELLISLRIKNEIRDQYAKVYSRANVLLMCPKLLRPKSKGEVTLASSRFETPPKIISNFLQDFDDVRTLIRGIRMGIELTKTKTFERDFDPELVEIKIEKCSSFKFKSDEYWECLLRHLTTSTFDASGTCKMGPPEDPMAVVDDELRVRGIKSLRVADSSIMPNIIRGSTSVASVMIGEKVSDLIINEWKLTKNDEL